MNLKRLKREREEQASSSLTQSIKLGVTLNLTGDLASLWQAYVTHNATMAPSNAQMVTSLMRIGLATWKAGL